MKAVAAWSPPPPGALRFPSRSRRDVPKLRAMAADKFPSYADALGKLGEMDLRREESVGLPIADLVAATRAEAPLDFSIEQLLATVVERDASDLHIKVGSPPGMRVDGDLRPMGDKPLKPVDTENLVKQLLTDDQWAKFQRDGDLDTSYAVPGVSRFRVNVLTQRRTIGMVVRRIPTRIPTIEDLQLPDVCRTLAERPRGLVLVTGPTGSGKSTTLAALVDHVNESRSGHIVTMEDPIEFVHEDKNCWVTQREIGTDCSDFKAALRRALRQDPDVILVGEMRDFETIGLAVTAAETGHLVFGTLHTTSAVQTIGRIVDVFPPAQQQQIRLQLADTLRGVVSQTLLPRADGRGRAAAMEIMTGTDGVRALIREGKTVQITNLIQTGAKEGMLTLEASLNRLVAERTITYETAVAKANNPAAIRDPAADPSAGPGYGGYGGYGGGPSQGRSGPTPTTPAGTKVRVPPPRPGRRR